MYADDIVLYNTIDNNYDAFLHDLQSVADWCQCNELTMNINKTKYQIFPNNRHTNVDTIADNHKIHIGTESLKHVKLYKYLGVEIDNQLTMKQHAIL